jgi:hypothetical protein
VWCQGLKPGTAQCGTGSMRPVEPPPPPAAAATERVFIVFSTHLDVGYTINQNGSCAGAVVNEWFEQLPSAIDTAAQFRQKQPHWRYQWMIHSWIASMFRHCAATGNSINIAGPGHPSELVCPSAANLSAFQAGVKAVSFSLSFDFLLSFPNKNAALLLCAPCMHARPNTDGCCHPPTTRSPQCYVAGRYWVARFSVQRRT